MCVFLFKLSLKRVVHTTAREVEFTYYDRLTCRPVDDPAKDVLSVEVWDFDPAETVKEKVTRVGEVKGFKGMKRFMKELAVTVTHGQHDNEIIGTTHIPLKVYNYNNLMLLFFFHNLPINVCLNCFFSLFTDDTVSRSENVVQFRKQRQTAGELVGELVVRERKEQGGLRPRTQASTQGAVDPPDKRATGNNYRRPTGTTAPEYTRRACKRSILI